MHYLWKLVFIANLMSLSVIAESQESTTKDTSEVLITIDRMTNAFAKGDINEIMSTYAPEAVVVGEPNKPVSGAPALQAMFASYIEAGVAFTYGAHEVIIAGDTALHLMKWTASQPNGEETSALSVAVLRRQQDGTWKMVIDHPFGDSVMRLQ